MDNRIFRVLSIKPFLYLWLAEVFSQIAFNMANFILILVAFELSNSNTAVSGIVLSFTIPAITFGFIAGAYVDRWNKKNVLFTSNAVRVFLLLLLALLHTNLYSIYILSFLIAIVTQFFIPAETPMIPLLVKKDLLLSANALFGIGVYGSIFIAYALSGPFIILFGNLPTFLIIAFLFLLASLFVFLIKVPLSFRKKEEQQSSYINSTSKALIDEIKSAFKLMARTKKVYQSLLLLTLSQVVILVLAVIGPGFATQILRINVNQFPLFIVAPAAFGMIVGALIIGNFLHGYKKQSMANLGVFLSGLSILLLPYGSKVSSRAFVETINSYLPHIFTIDILHIMILLAFILGFSNALIFVPSNTILQEETSEELRGKVYGALNALTGIFSLFPVIIVGGLADLLGVARVLTGVGAVLILISIFRRFLIREK